MSVKPSCHVLDPIKRSIMRLTCSHSNHVEASGTLGAAPSCGVGDMLVDRSRVPRSGAADSQPSGRLTAEGRLLRASPVADPANACGPYSVR